MLKWLSNLTDIAEKNKKYLKDFRDNFRKAASDCLLEELNRIANENNGSIWEKIGKEGHKISHSRYKKYVELGFLSRLTLTAQGFTKKRIPIFEKVILPFGTQVEQVYHLLDICARDIYYFYFVDEAQRKKYLGNSRKIDFKRSKIKMHYWDLFDFAYKNRFKLQVLLEELPKLYKSISEEEIKQDIKEISTKATCY